MTVYSRVSLGLFLFWVTTAVLADALPAAPVRPQIDQNGVDVQSLSFSYSHKDLSIGPAVPHGLSYTFSFNSWTYRDSFDNNVRVYTPTQGATQYTISLGNHTDTFGVSALNPSNLFVSDLGNGASVSQAGDVVTYTMRDGTSASFGHLMGTGTNSDGSSVGYWAADTVTYPDGLIVSYHYLDASCTVDGVTSPHTRLQSVTTNTGWQLKFTYQVNAMDATCDATSNEWLFKTAVTAINNAVEYCDPTANSCTLTGSWAAARYSYDSTYRYEQDATGGITRLMFNYGTPSAVYSIKTSDDTGADNRSYTVYVENDPYAYPIANGNVAQHVRSSTVDQRTIAYTMSGPASSTDDITVTAVNSLNGTRQYVGVWGSPLGVVSYTDGLSRSSSFTYDGYGRLTGATGPEGMQTITVYDNGNLVAGRGNVTSTTVYPEPGSAEATSGKTLPESWVFPALTDPGCSSVKLCNKPTSYTDPNGNLTTYTYDPNSGNIATETSPADQHGVNPVKRYFYQPYYAGVLTSTGGTYAWETAPVYLLSEERICLTSSTNTPSSSNLTGSCTAGSSDEVVTDYYYGLQPQTSSNPVANNLLVRGAQVRAVDATGTGTTRVTCYAYDIYGNKISTTLPNAGISSATSCP